MIDWNNTLFQAMADPALLTDAMRKHRQFPNQPVSIMLSKWVVDDIPVIVGRGGGHFEKPDMGDRLTLIEPADLGQQMLLTDVGQITAAALMSLPIPVLPNAAFYVVEIRTDLGRPTEDDLRLRLARIWKNLDVAPWSRILMIGDMAKNLDGVLIRAMNTYTDRVTTVREIAAEMQATTIDPKATK